MRSPTSATATSKRPKPISAGDAPSNRASPRVLTLRLVALALLLAVSVPVVGVYTVSVYGSDDPGSSAVSYVAISVLLLFVLLNRLWRRVRPTWALSPAQLVTLYFVTALCASFCSYESLFMLVSGMVYPLRFADPTNRWASLFLDRLPGWTLVQDPAAVRAFYEGGHNLFTSGLYHAWLGPIGWWTLFVMALVGAFLALDVLMTRRWIAQERLAFPLVEIPLALAAPPGERSRSLFGSGWGWSAIAVAASLHLWSHLADLFPILPALPLAREIDFSTTVKPWHALGYHWLFWGPETFGLAFLIPADLSFSLWCFSLFWCAELMLTEVYGATVSSHDFPYVPAQTTGAYLGIAVLILWSARHYLADIVRATFAGQGKVPRGGYGNARHRTVRFGAQRQDSGRLCRPEERIALGALLACLAILIGFAVRMGMHPLVASAFMLLYLAFALTVTRLRAQLGVPFHDLHQVNPVSVLMDLRGSDGLRVGDMAGFASFYWFNRTYRASPMPPMLEGIQGATVTHGNPRSLPLLFLGCALVAVLVTLGSNVFLMTRWGAATAHIHQRIFLPGSDYSGTPWNNLGSWLQSGRLASFGASMAMGVGFLTSLALAALRSRFFGFPLHPIAFAISASTDATGYILALSVAWPLKALVLRYGGYDLHRRAVQFATGLIIGAAIVDMLASVVIGPLLG